MIYHYIKKNVIIWNRNLDHIKKIIQNKLKLIEIDFWRKSAEISSFLKNRDIGIRIIMEVEETLKELVEMIQTYSYM